jgi:uncharacterized protein YegL
MSKRIRASALVAALLVFPALVAAQRGPGPVRIVLLVDSSTTVSTMVPQFRAGLNAFLDALPGDPEIALISTGGQIRIRVPLTTDRDRLHKAANAFTADGGANSFLDTLLEADKRFLQRGDRYRPVFVILMTDATEVRGDARLDQYNRWVSDFLQRGGRAHGIVVRGVNSGVTTAILENLTSNTNGFYDSLNVPNPLAERMRALASIVAVDMP